MEQKKNPAAVKLAKLSHEKRKQNPEKYAQDKAKLRESVIKRWEREKAEKSGS